MELLLIDNYDSFTFNLVHYFESIDAVNVTVVRNDKITIDSIYQYDGVILSPGPGLPEQSGLLMEVVKHAMGNVPLLGICLGMQAIGLQEGGKLKNLTNVFHGIATKIRIDLGDPIFKDMPSTIEVGRYHSWVIDPNFFPATLVASGFDAAGNIMACRHKIYNCSAVQFHPESILTPLGQKIIENWVQLCK